MGPDYVQGVVKRSVRDSSYRTDAHKAIAVHMRRTDTRKAIAIHMRRTDARKPIAIHMRRTDARKGPRPSTPHPPSLLCPLCPTRPS
jgi:hypothetical protein